jgi:hypothetical protein
MPNLNPLPITYEGAFSGDAREQVNDSFEQQLVGTAVVVQATNPTVATNLMTATLNANSLDTIGSALEIFGAGIVNLTTTTSAVTFAVILGGVTIATFTTGNFAIGALNLPWNMTLCATVTSVAQGGGVTVECHGNLNASLTTAVGSVTTFNDINVAVSSSIAFGSPVLLQFQATLAAGNAASFVSQRQLTVELLN